MIKGAIYSFLLGVLLGLLIFPDKEVISIAKGVTETVYEPLRVYFMKVIRFASIITLFTVIVIWIKETIVFTKNKANLMELIRNFCVAFVSVLVLILVVSLVYSRIS